MTNKKVTEGQKCQLKFDEISILAHLFTFWVTKRQGRGGVGDGGVHKAFLLLPKAQGFSQQTHAVL